MEESARVQAPKLFLLDMKIWKNKNLVCSWNFIFLLNNNNENSFFFLKKYQITALVFFLKYENAMFNQTSL